MVIRTAVIGWMFGGAVAIADPATSLGTAPPAPRAPVSLRAEATRVATDLVQTGSRSDPDLLLTPWRISRWSANGRAAKLEGGAAAATFIGELILGFGGSPLAAVGALATGATLDAGAADVEADSPARTIHKARPHHRLR